MSRQAEWALLCCILAAIPWALIAYVGKVRQITIAQVLLMMLVLAIGFSAMRFD